MWTFQYKHGDRPLDGYTIQRAAGRGGFGEVYYALSDSGREVALKAVQGYEQIELRGISQCMNLKSPHLVSIFDVRHNDQGRPFVIMEFVNGPSLRQLLDEAPSGLGEQKAAFFLREISKGLTFLHDCGIVHRDLKPGNVFYENGYVKIGDYGLSKAISVGGTSQQTVTVGTVHYMAPEIGGGNYDRSIDIYAMGACLFEMLTGTVPFVGASPSEILMKHLSADPDCSGIAEPFCSVIKKAMHKDPARRYQSVQEMVEAVFGAEHVRNSISMFAADELSVVAGKVAGRMNAPGVAPAGYASPPRTASSSVVGQGKPVATGNVWSRLNERDARAYAGPVDDPMPARDRWILALITSGVIAIAVIALASRRGSPAVEYGVGVFMASWGATFGLLFGMRRARSWDLSHPPHKFFLGGLALGGAIFCSGGLLVVPTQYPMQTWIAIAIPLVFLGPVKWMRGDRHERISIKAGLAAGFVAMICSAVFHGSALVSVGVVSAVAMMAQVLSPWNPSARREPRDADGVQNESAAARAAGMPAPFYVGQPVSPAFNSNEANIAATPPISALPADFASASTSIALSSKRRTPVAFRVVMLVLCGVALVAGLTCVIAFGSGVAGGPEGPPTVAFGVCALVLAAAALQRSRCRTMKSWWSLLVKPAMLLICVESIVASAVVMGNAHFLQPDERMIGVFFIVFPAVMSLVLLIAPGTIRDEDAAPPPGVDVSGEISPYKRLWTLLLAGLGFCGFNGIHRIYVGKTGSGIAYLVTFGWFYVGTIVDIINICAGRFTDGSGRLLLQWEDEPLGMPVPAGAAAPTAPRATPAPWMADAASHVSTPANSPRTWMHDVRDQVSDARGKIVDASARMTRGSQRRAMRKAIRAAKFKAMAAAHRPPRDIRVVTGGVLAVLAAMLIFASFISAAALALDVPGFLAAGLPNVSVAKHLETEVFGYPEWPTLMRKLGALAVGMTMLLGLTFSLFARRRAGFSHMLRGAIGAAGLLVSVIPIAKNVRDDVMWQDVAPLFQQKKIGLGVDDVLSQLNRGKAPYVAGGFFLTSVILLSWPERRATRVTPFALQPGPVPMGGRASAYRATVPAAATSAAAISPAAISPAAISPAAASKAVEPAKGA